MIKHFEKHYDNENFVKYDNFYTIRNKVTPDNVSHLSIIYGHFFDDHDLFLFKNVYTDIVDISYVDDFNICKSDELLSSASNKFYRFNSYNEVKHTLNTIKASRKDDGSDGSYDGSYIGI